MARKNAAKNEMPMVPDEPQLWHGSMIESWSIGRLKPYVRNAREHPKKQIDQLKAAIERFGFTIPLLARENGTLIAGHGRLLAAQALGMQDVPVIVARGWSEAKCRQYTIADNKLQEMSSWDEKLLAHELAELSLLDADLSSTGLSEREINKLLGPGSQPVPPDTTPQLDGLIYSIVIRCNGEQQQTELLDEFESKGLTCEAMIS